ncbi:MAG: TRAP transporter small permease subunit [Spirochaetaceae bacterium]|nr:TRAP transporter small permease subunit [Myxococcales bacterium]MCB9723586.1 TRAP transporter small permease subunit [Spirochaetaceae bacterium]HPG27696.1 TRAP transporter small permease subunit [Myxococcota bacterium]
MGVRRGPIEDRIDRGLDRVALVSSWVWLALIGTIGACVVLRYVFGITRVELEEAQWHLHAVGFLAGIVGCAVRDRHVRVDVLRDRMRPRTRDWVDFYGGLLLLAPLLALVLWSALPFVAESFATGERSVSPGGLGHRWLLKAALPLAGLGLALATAGGLLRIGRRLFGRAGSASDPGDAKHPGNASAPASPPAPGDAAAPDGDRDRAS